MTPCEKLGYKVGDKFVVVRLTGMSRSTVGDILTLDIDDGTNYPIFRKENCINTYCPDLPNIVKLEGDGWIGWKGGEMPVDRETLVDVVCRGGGRNSRNKKARQYHWGHDGDFSDIVAYRPHQAEQSAPSTLFELLQAWQKAKANLQSAEQVEVAARKAFTDAMRAAGLLTHVAAEQPLNITDWRDLKPGDIIWWSGDNDFPEDKYTVIFVDRDSKDACVLHVRKDNGSKGWVKIDEEQWRFVRRP